MAGLTGVSPRTLRYYEEIDLLTPDRDASSGYRIYGPEEVDRMQQILLFREMEMPLDEIRAILHRPDFDLQASLTAHRRQLVERRERLDRLIQTVDRTIGSYKGEIEMTDKEKFEGFKKEQLENNEKHYGAEIREKYGEETVEASNEKFMNLSEADFEAMKQVESELFETLEELVGSKDVQGESGRRVYEKHRAWLGYTWPSYSPEAHIGLAEMYVADERFAQYYNDRAGKDVVTLLRDAIATHAKR
jgi:DNA-binding transcriptional MerR regulator